MNDFDGTKYVTVNRTSDEHNITVETREVKTEEMLIFILLQTIQTTSSNNKMKVIECLLDNRNENGEISISYKNIKTITKLSLQTVQNVMTELIATRILIKSKPKIYKINEDIININNSNKKSIKINITYKGY